MILNRPSKPSKLSKTSKTIFELEACYVENKYNKKKDVHLPPSYPLKLESCRQIGYFSSLRKAESAIKETVKENSNAGWETLYCFYVTEYLIDERYYNVVTRRSYLSDGKLEETCLTFEGDCGYDRMDLENCLSKTPEELHRMGIFPGRRPEEMRFKEGDLVEYVEYNKRVVLGIVVSTPRTVEYAREQAKKNGYFHQDCSDDMYNILTDFPLTKEEMENGHPHSHCDTITLFLPRFNVPKRIREGLQAACKVWMDKENKASKKS